MATTAPYGSWASPITTDLLASEGGVSFSYLDISEEGVYWTESRPEENGRSALVFRPHGGEPADVVPPHFNVRTRVHEYGGGAWFRHGRVVFCSSFDDSRLYRIEEPGAEPRPITPEPSEPHALRYADGRVFADGRLIVCVRELHGEGEPVNELVVLPADGSTEPRVVANGRDFYAAPRPSPDGASLAWLAWDHPHMPFEGTDLCVADLAPDGSLSNDRRVAGSEQESIFQPEWSRDGLLHFVSDRTGWSNLYVERGGEVRGLTHEDAELGYPQWVFDLSRYAFLADGRIACLFTRAAIDSLEVLDPRTGKLERLELPYSSYSSPSPHSHGTRLVFAASTPTEPTAVIELELGSGVRKVLRRSTEMKLDEGYISLARAIDFPGADGLISHGFYYAPLNPEYFAPDDELPPLVVLVHGGPTAHVTSSLDLYVQLFTSRGIAVVDLNYGGSTGYGREYRDRLRGRWGEIDIEDSAAAARYLGEHGDVDPERIQITGGSAGGYTTLMALAVRDEFASGVSYYGVADLVTFHEETHKFESHYDEYLVGPWPEALDLYRDRSPVAYADSISDPLLLLQGLDDKVVPPSQAEVIVDALKRRDIPYAYIAFAGEGHGFRKAENIKRAAEAHLSFLAQVSGFEPADDIEPIDIENLDAASTGRRRIKAPPATPRAPRPGGRPRRGNRLVVMGVADLTRNAVDVLPKGELERKLELGRPLRVKLGIDPTAPDIHLGFAYVLDRLAEFQREGHTVVLIVGDYTARIGDPSGRSDERPILPGEVLDANAKAFAEQAFRVLDRERTEIRFNGEWLGKLSYAEVVRLARTITVARILERDDFAQRFAAHEPISISELLYPLMQAYDSVAIEADIEIGGTDQLYNLLAGRDVMQDYGLDPQLVMTYPLLVGVDGEDKMSKSRGNYIGVGEPPEEMFGKTMSIPDKALPQWWEMLAGGGPHPDDRMQWKLELARRIVSRWHGEEGARLGEDHFTRVVREHQAPEEVPEVQLPSGDPVHLPTLLVEHFGIGSTSEARRLISQGGVRIDGEPATEIDIPRARLESALVQAGRRRFMRFSGA